MKHKHSKYHQDEDNHKDQDQDYKDYDRQAVKQLYDKLLQNFKQLDTLTKTYRHKQQDHFIKTFSAILHKMAEELMEAKEAFANIDMQVKKDEYCMSLKEEIKEMNSYALELGEVVKSKEIEVKRLKGFNQMLEVEMHSLRIINESKIEECLNLREEVRGLKKKFNCLLNLKKQSDNNIIINSSSNNSSAIHENKDKIHCKTLDLKKPHLNFINSSRQDQSTRQNYMFKHHYAVRTAAEFKSKHKIDQLEQLTNNSLQNSLNLTSNLKPLESKQKSSGEIVGEKICSQPFQDKLICQFKMDRFTGEKKKFKMSSFRGKFNLSLSKTIDHHNPQASLQINI